MKFWEKFIKVGAKNDGTDRKMQNFAKNRKKLQNFAKFPDFDKRVLIFAKIADFFFLQKFAKF